MKHPHRASTPTRTSPGGLARRVGAAVAVALVVAGTLVAVSLPAAAQEDGQVRIAAKKHADGRVEFALQTRQTDNTWGKRLLPTKRFFPTTAPVGRWLNSTPLTAAGATVRITARKHADARIEFALQQRQTDNTWSKRLLPDKRFFPTTAPVGRWLNSTPLTPTTTPTDGYTAIAAGDSHACAIRTDGTITCWGDNDDGQADAPDGTYTDIAAGEGASCAIATDRTITCWGASWAGTTDVPDGTYTDIAAGEGAEPGFTPRDGWCALHTDATITCWGGLPSSATYRPDGTYTAIAIGLNHACAIRTNGTIACWTEYPSPADPAAYDAPDGTYTAISTAGYLLCAIATDRTITCWGSNAFGQADAPGGTYTAISTAGYHSCAIATDRTITCWGSNTFGQADAPGGTYTAIAAGLAHSCAIRTDGTITCWGDNYDGQTDAPGG